MAIAPAGCTQGARKSFEERFDLVMTGTAVQNPHMDIRLGSAGEALEEIMDEFGLKITDEAGVNFGVDDRCGASAEVDSGDSQRLVHRHDEIAGPQNATFRAEGLSKGLAERDSDIFDCVVLVDVKVARRFEFEIEAAVVGEEFEHVVEESDAGGDLIAAFAFDGEGQSDLRFLGDAIDGGFSHRRAP